MTRSEAITAALEEMQQKQKDDQPHEVVDILSDEYTEPKLSVQWKVG